MILAEREKELPKTPRTRTSRQSGHKGSLGGGPREETHPLKFSKWQTPATICENSFNGFPETRQIAAEN